MSIFFQSGGGRHQSSLRLIDTVITTDGRTVPPTTTNHKNGHSADWRASPADDERVTEKRVDCGHGRATGFLERRKRKKAENLYYPKKKKNLARAIGTNFIRARSAVGTNKLRKRRHNKSKKKTGWRWSHRLVVVKMIVTVVVVVASAVVGRGSPSSWRSSLSWRYYRTYYYNFSTPSQPQLVVASSHNSGALLSSTTTTTASPHRQQQQQIQQQQQQQQQRWHQRIAGSRVVVEEVVVVGAVVVADRVVVAGRVVAAGTFHHACLRIISNLGREWGSRVWCPYENERMQGRLPDRRTTKPHGFYTFIHTSRVCLCVYVPPTTTDDNARPRTIIIVSFAALAAVAAVAVPHPRAQRILLDIRSCTFSFRGYFCFPWLFWYLFAIGPLAVVI
jgi:hypothetical protein